MKTKVIIAILSGLALTSCGGTFTLNPATGAFGYTTPKFIPRGVTIVTEDSAKSGLKSDSKAVLP